MTGKRWGRIGDSPLIGAGTFADDRACAVSCTGSGEFFIRVGVGHEIAARIRLAGDTAQAAADAVMAEVRALGGTGGVIVTTPAGDACGASPPPACTAPRATAAGCARSRSTATSERHDPAMIRTEHGVMIRRLALLAAALLATAEAPPRPRRWPPISPAGRFGRATMAGCAVPSMTRRLHKRPNGTCWTPG